MTLSKRTVALFLCAASTWATASLAQRPVPPGATASMPTGARGASDDTARDARLTRADRGRVRGKTEAVWIVVISDFQCPFCKKWHEETFPRIEQEYVRTGKAQIAYMNFPLAGSHPNAPLAHELAMCAAEQGQFWPIADALFRTQRGWATRRDLRAALDSLARGIALDQRRLASCLDARDMKVLVEADYTRAVKLGVTSTPSFLVGGRPLIGAQPYDAFQRAIEAALTEQRTPAPGARVPEAAAGASAGAGRRR